MPWKVAVINKSDRIQLLQKSKCIYVSFSIRLMYRVSRSMYLCIYASMHLRIYACMYVRTTDGWMDIFLHGYGPLDWQWKSTTCPHLCTSCLLPAAFCPEQRSNNSSSVSSLIWSATETRSPGLKLLCLEETARRGRTLYCGWIRKDCNLTMLAASFSEICKDISPNTTPPVTTLHGFDDGIDPRIEKFQFPILSLCLIPLY